MNKRKLAYSIIPALGLVGVLGAGVASANGMFGGMGGFGLSNLTPDQIAERQIQAFRSEAALLGLTVDEIKQAWADGKTPKDLMTEKGIKPEDVQARAKDLAAQKLRSDLQTLVDKGVITQAQADARLKVMTDRLANAKTKGFGRHMGMRGFWR